MMSSGLRRMGLNRAECETRFQKASSAARAPSGPPAANPATSTAPFIAPAEVPDMPSMRSQDSSRSRSSTPQVKAPWDPPPCSARSTSTELRSDLGSFAMIPRIQRAIGTAGGAALTSRRELRIRTNFFPAEPRHIQCGQENQREDCPDQQSSHDGEGHRSPKHRRRDRNHAENRRDRRQHDGAKTRAARIDRRLPDVLALTSFSFDLADQDHGVLGDHAEQRQNAQDRNKSERFAGQQQRSHDTDQSQRSDAQDDE